MKRFIFSFLICCFSFAANAQKLDGIGIFKLGARFDVLQSWVSENNATIEEVRDGMSTAYAAGTGATKVLILLPNDEGPYKSDSNANFVEGYKSIYINRYIVGDLTIENISLLFYQDALVEVGTDLSDSLKMALRAKYGEPKQKIETKDIKCVYTLTGVTKKETDYTTTLTWTNDKKTMALAYEIIMHDDKCQLISNSKSEVLSISSKKETSNYVTDNIHAKERYYKSKENTKLNGIKKSLEKL